MDVAETNAAAAVTQSADGERGCVTGGREGQAAAAAKSARRQLPPFLPATEVAGLTSGVQTRAKRAQMTPTERRAEKQQQAELERKAAEAKAARAAAAKRVKEAKRAEAVLSAGQPAVAVPAQRPLGRGGRRC